MHLPRSSLLMLVAALAGLLLSFARLVIIGTAVALLASWFTLMVGVGILTDMGWPEQWIRAVAAHADYTGIPRDTPLAQALFAVDELCGFCMACAMVQPDRKIAQVKVKSVKKKLKKKDFAAKVNREEIREGAEDLGLELDEVIEHVLSALVPVGDDLGL